MAVLGATLAVSLAYHLAGYPAGPTNLPVLVAIYSAAAAGRLLPALLASGAFFGVGFAYRSLTLALLGDATSRRRAARAPTSTATLQPKITPDSPPLGDAPTGAGS